MKLRCETAALRALKWIESFLAEPVLSTLLIARRNRESSYPRWWRSIEPPARENSPRYLFIRHVRVSVCAYVCAAHLRAFKETVRTNRPVGKRHFPRSAEIESGSRGDWIGASTKNLLGFLVDIKALWEILLCQRLDGRLIDNPFPPSPPRPRTDINPRSRNYSFYPTARIFIRRHFIPRREC